MGKIRPGQLIASVQTAASPDVTDVTAYRNGSPATLSQAHRNGPSATLSQARHIDSRFTVCIVLEVQGVADVNPLVSFLKAPKLRSTLCYVSEAKEHTLRIPKLRSRRCQVSEAKEQSLSASQSLRVIRLSRIQVARSRVL